MKILIFSTLLLLNFSCATKKEKSAVTDNLNKTKIEKSFKKGKTKKADVINLLGSPEMVNSNSNGTEQWVYSQTESLYQSKDRSLWTGLWHNFQSLISWASIGVGGSNYESKRTSLSKTLSIEFDKKGRLNSYTFNIHKA